MTDDERQRHPFLAHPVTVAVAGVVAGLIVVATATLLLAVVLGWRP